MNVNIFFFLNNLVICCVFERRGNCRNCGCIVYLLDKFIFKNCNLFIESE